MADGSVKFFKNTISAQVWSALSSPRGNEWINESDINETRSPGRWTRFQWKTSRVG